MPSSTQLLLLAMAVVVACLALAGFVHADGPDDFICKEDGFVGTAVPGQGTRVAAPRTCRTLTCSGGVVAVVHVLPV